MPCCYYIQKCYNFLRNQTMFKIQTLHAREILDSRGNPTIEVDCVLEDGSAGRASVPSGASTGSHEALELRDKNGRYRGKGVTHAVDNVKTLVASALVGKDFSQRSLDEALIALDGTPHKEKLGANALLGVSLAFGKASALAEKKRLADYFHALAPFSHPLTLPTPLMNVINGGVHAPDSTDVQEWMLVPYGAPSFKEALRYGAETFHALKMILAERSLSTLVGDEGGFAPALGNSEEVFELLLAAMAKAGYKPGVHMGIALDVAASELYRDGVYHFDHEGKSFNSSELIERYRLWCDTYPIVSIEDGLAEDDWEGHTQLTEVLGSRVQLVGDDLFCTTLSRIEEGVAKKAANAVLIKLNQIGTLTETVDAMIFAEVHGYRNIISHRSGETEDTIIADLAVGSGCGQIKTGSLSRGERVAKYNQLLRLEELYGESISFAGKNVFQ